MSETKEKREATPAEMWDQLSFKLIQQTLAPRGFKEIKSGHYKGLNIANTPAPGLEKSKVFQSQKLAAQLVRSYREKAKSKLKSIIKELDVWVKEDEIKLKACRFWEFRKKQDLKYKIRSLYGQGGSASRILHELDNISIK
jgi:hypothetical protein